jgi:N-acetylglucosamine-6-phosphate deacetylase
VNGYRGVDFSCLALSVDTAATAVRGLLSDGGCAAILPTVISSALAVYDHVLPILAEVIEMEEFAGRLLGIHLEGPFISSQPGAVGCHNPDNVVSPPSIPLMERWQTLAKGHVRLVTVAAESCAAGTFVSWCVAHNIAVSLGHQLASVSEIDAATGMGATGLTHLGNGLPNMVHRHKNAIWKGLSDDRLTAMIITDGNHLPKELIRTIVRAKGPRKVIVTSDCAPVAGLPSGEYDCFGTRVVVDGNNVRSADLPCLAGSGALMFHCMNHLFSVDRVLPAGWGSNEFSLARLHDRVGLENPLAFIGIDATAWVKSTQVKKLVRSNNKYMYIERFL